MKCPTAQATEDPGLATQYAQERESIQQRAQRPSQPSKELMLSTEVCTYLRAVAEAATAQDAGNLWQPGPAQATTLKRLQPKKRGYPPLFQD